ncbi:dihydrodipicolinate synthase family protein [Aquisalibacillus elongatus]|uniref:Dihydrodipicolinate synthase/N-acetylneuraminate lyase n=1 Tax=Aquisalibacillus elongatus TaxID=485577 RepID=A0A3N5BBH6_9BACI|nr:dihydrodipicolinate synthase family protein [Aquisalibacillus elongatus]RPF54279.1 dihydrodipicolinate synthase/N-acetylneuraminate lyase [Aquisalibacillus elongatus]
MIKEPIKQLLEEGTVIPAHPLALNEDKMLDEAGQRALTRYYIDAGTGGVAVGVHTTQFEIRDPKFNLYEKVLKLAMEEIEAAGITDSFIKVAGIAGPTEQAVQEARYAKSLGYDLGLLSMGGLDHLSEDEILERARKVAAEIPLFGFYLQPAVGGRVFSYDFWRQFADIEHMYAIKMAPFNRYYTLDVVRAVSHSKRREDISLYTGNDDNIINDLLTTYRVSVDGQPYYKPIVGGLLGHWSVWTKEVVKLFDEIKRAREEGVFSQELLTKAQEVTDCNAAFFDAANQFKGSIAGINEVLARQGLLKGNWCLMDHEQLSAGQKAEIDRVYQEYPHLNDDEFVKQRLDQWFS